MKILKRRLLVRINILDLWVLLFLAGASSQALAMSNYLANFNANYGTQGTRIDRCGICHYNFNGGGARNPYGQDFQNNNFSITAIGSLNSDGDGSTNDQEATLLTFPGLSCDNVGSTLNAPSDITDYVDPSNPGCITRLASDIVIDFGGIGLWARINDSSWLKLNNNSPDKVITGDVDGNGIDDVIADFGSSIGGVFIKRNGGAWSQLHTFTTESMASGDLDGNGSDDIVIDFGGIGLWARMNDSSWLKLNNTSPDQLVVITDMDGNGMDDVIADYGSTLGGVYTKLNSGAWTKLHNTSPSVMATGDLDANGSGDVIINFGAIGLWARMNNTSWLKLHNGSPENIVAGDVDGNGADDVIAGFGNTTGGVWQKLNLLGWTKLNNNAPEQMVMGDIDANGQSDLVGAFNNTLGGIYVRRNNGIWAKLHNADPEDLAAGELDGN